jgi:predicted DNA-binding transcriptional regulator AlpA
MMSAANNEQDNNDDCYQTVTAEWLLKRLVISRRTLDRIVAGDKTFPAPLLLPGGVRRWNRRRVLAWIAKHTDKGDG